MRSIILFSVFAMATLAFFWLEPTASKGATTPSGNAASGIDPGAKVVRDFYDALLQKEPPTIEQDSRLFMEPETWRQSLVNVKKLHADNPLLTWFRQHRDLFIPKNMRSPAEIQVSSTFNFVCNLVRTKSQPVGSGLVMVLFVDDTAAPPDHRQFRTLIFEIEDGKIDPAYIRLNGFEGKMTIELFADQKIK